MKNVQDIYPASPMQEFMLLHGLSQAGHDTLFNQFVFRVDHVIRPEFFESAWNQVAAAHTSLRTAFIWQGVDSPQQVVRQNAKVPCKVVDLSSHDGASHDSAVTEILSQDRNAGFDFRRAPLMRFILIKLDEASWRVIWSSHHLIVDRWCIDQLMEEFQSYYRANIALSPIATKRAPSYRDYIAWIKTQDSKAAHEHWVSYLKGFSRPTNVEKICASVGLKDEPHTHQASHAVGPVVARQARSFSAQNGVTLGCTVQAALALAVNRLVGNSDVVFGVTVAGRPAGLAHVEEIVGTFISTLPVRVRLDKTLTVAEWLRDLNGAQFANADYDYLSPAQLHKCSSVPSDQAMFDLLLVWLAQTKTQSETYAEDELPLVPVSGQYATAYPITISVIETPDDLIFRADSSASTEQPLGGFLRYLLEALESLVAAAPEMTLGMFHSPDLQSEDTTTEVQDPVQPDRINISDSGEVSGSVGRENVRIDAMQDVLCGEWQRVLATDSTIELDDDFFDLGGNSLKAAALHTRIESATRKAIPLLALFEHTTLRGMAATLVNEKWPLRAGIVLPLQTSGIEAPLFCVASPEVNTLGYAMLTRRLPRERNVVVLQAPPRSDRLEQLHPDELPEFAANYIQALRDVQPTGPYSLLSMCSGAHIAYHMIRQLEAEGEQVRFAGVINTWSLYSISWRFRVNRLANVAGYYVQRVTELVQKKAGRLVSQSASQTETDSPAETVAVSEPGELRALSAETTVGLGSPWIRQVGFAARLPDDQPVNTTVSVFRLARQPYWRIDDDTLGWSRLAHTTDVVTISGDVHISILREPYIQQIAEALERQLATVDAKRLVKSA